MAIYKSGSTLTGLGSTLRRLGSVVYGLGVRSLASKLRNLSRLSANCNFLCSLVMLGHGVLINCTQASSIPQTCWASALSVSKFNSWELTKTIQKSSSTESILSSLGQSCSADTFGHILGPLKCNTREAQPHKQSPHRTFWIRAATVKIGLRTCTAGLRGLQIGTAKPDSKSSKPNTIQ